MSKFDQLLNYKSNCGRQFELLEGEKLVVDGVDYTVQSGSRASYVLFITNQRLILKQGNISWNSRGIESAFLADVRYMMLDDLKSVSINGWGIGGYQLAITGTFKDFSVKEKTGDSEYEVGGVSKGFSGMEYTTEKELYQGLTRTFKGLSDQYGFGTYFTGENAGMSTLSKEEGLATVNEHRRALLGVVAFSLILFGGLGAGAYFFAPGSPRNSPPEATSSRTFEPSRQATQQPVEPKRQVRAQPPVTIQNRTKQSTCWTSAFAGSDGTKLNSYDCRVRSLSTSAGLMIFVNWSDGVETQFVIREDKTATIYGDGSTAGVNAEWWEYTHNGVEMISIQSSRGAQSWINVNDALDANPNSY